jgi:hypothetical protein
MKSINIELTEQQEYFLKKFASNHYEGSKQNLCTYKPIHLVQTSRERVVNPDYDSPDKVVWISKDDYEEQYDSVEELVRGYYKYDKCPIEIISYEDAYNKDEFIGVYGDEFVISDEKDYLKAYDIDLDDYYKTHIEYYYETVAYFFSLDEAKRYIEYQSHNLNNPRTYTVSMGYANKGEYEPFWDLLMSIGVKLNSEGVR